MTSRLLAEDECGFALPIAIFALVVMAGLVAGSFFAGRLEQQTSRNTLFAGQAAEAAEAGLVEAFNALSPATLAALPVGGAPLKLGPMSFGVRFSVERQVSRLTSTLFLVQTLAARQDVDGSALAVRTLGSLLRLMPDPLGDSPSMTFLRQRSWVQLH